MGLIGRQGAIRATEAPTEPQEPLGAIEARLGAKGATEATRGLYGATEARLGLVGLG